MGNLFWLGSHSLAAIAARSFAYSQKVAEAAFIPSNPYIHDRESIYLFAGKQWCRSDKWRHKPPNGTFAIDPS